MPTELDGEDLRERLLHAPVGVWGTGRRALTAQRLDFRDDGKGICTVDTPAGPRTFRFEWREHAEGSLRVREVGRDHNHGEPPVEEEWLDFVFDLLPIPTPRGEEIAMRVIRFGRLADMPDLLFYQGEAEDAEELEASISTTRPRPEPHDPLHGIFLPSVFITGLLAGITLVVLKEANIALDPEEAILGGFLLFFVVTLLVAWFSRPARPKEPPVSEEYSAGGP
jgi:hypothetical protein